MEYDSKRTKLTKSGNKEIIALNLGTIHETVFILETIITPIATVFDNDALYLDSPSTKGK